MKYFILLSLLAFANFSFGQVKYAQTFDQLLVRKMKLFGEHYLMHFDHFRESNFAEFVLNKNDRRLSSGLAVMNTELEYEWIYILEKGKIVDFWEDSEFMYILNAQGKNAKINSSAQLFLQTLNKEGTLIGEEKIGDVSFDQPNGRFDAKFDQNGGIWKITEIPSGSSTGFSKTRPGKPRKSYIIESLSLNLEKRSTNVVEGSYLDFDAFDSTSDEVSFVFSADSIFLNGKMITGDHATKGIPSVLLLQFNTEGELTRNDYIGSGSITIKEIHYQGDNLIVGGSFKGNETRADLPLCYFGEIPLSSPKSYISNDLALNSFVASLDTSLTVNWLNTMSGSCSILFNSLSASDDELVVSFNFKDSVSVGGTQIYSLKEKTKYEYSDAIFCQFNAVGELTGHQLLPCYTSEWSSSGWNKVWLFPDHIAVHGTFLKNATVYDKQLHSSSKNSVYYLMFVEQDKKR